MAKFKAIFKRSDESTKVIKICNNREEAVDACVNYVDNYCLDSKEERIESLKFRDFYVCGCGPEEFIIEEIK